MEGHDTTILKGSTISDRAPTKAETLLAPFVASSFLSKDKWGMLEIDINISSKADKPTFVFPKESSITGPSASTPL